MKKTFKNFRFNLLAIAFLLITFSCDKDNESEPLIIQEKFNAPSIENAKQFFNQNSGLQNKGLTQAKSSSSTLLTDWESSKTKDYKETPEADIDILYTPIYLQTDKNAKAFLASTQEGNNIESKIVVSLYKNTSSQNSLSAYIFIFNLDGTLELKYNIENNQPIPFTTNTANRQTSNRTMSFDCNAPILSLGNLIEYIQKCTIQLDEVLVIGGGGGESGGEEGNSFDADLPNFLQIPYIGDMDSEELGGGTSGAVNAGVYASNIIAPTSASISTALGLVGVSSESEWLEQQSIENPSLLDAIAEYLNLSKKIPYDPVYEIYSPNQFIDVSDEAIDYIIDFINFLDDNPVLGSGGMSQQEFNDLENCYENNDNFVVCFEEFFDDQIFIDQDFKDNDCLKSVYDQMGKATKFQEYLQNFEPDASVAHLRFRYDENFKINQLEQYHNALAITEPPLGNTNVADYNINITFNGDVNLTSSIHGKSKLIIAVSFIHEMIHAEIFRKMLSAAQFGNLDPVNMTPEQQVNFVNNLQNNFEGIWDYYVDRWREDWGHQLMAQHYVDIIVSAISEYDNNAHSQATYEALAWVGLYDTIAWENLTTEQQTAHETNRENFEDNATDNCD